MWKLLLTRGDKNELLLHTNIQSHITIIYKQMLQVANEIATLYQALM